MYNIEVKVYGITQSKSLINLEIPFKNTQFVKYDLYRFQNQVPLIHFTYCVIKTKYS